ncbi:MAG: hypothetical protein OXF01_02085 [Gemmatimonadetes bacterium]|nr:hypothetical protein [Gemmatimonadota bacterium]
MLFRTVLVSALAVVPAGAQPVDSFRELAELVELGEDVRVTHRGQVLEGRVLDISPTSLTVLAGGVPLELDEAAVTRIRQRWDDPLQDGAKRGFLWGSIPATAVFLYFVKEDGQFPADAVAEGLLVTVGLAGGIGAGIGALIDGARRDQRDIYRRAPGRRVALRPLFSRERLGVRVAVAW